MEQFFRLFTSVFLLNLVGFFAVAFLLLAVGLELLAFGDGWSRFAKRGLFITATAWIFLSLARTTQVSAFLIPIPCLYALAFAEWMGQRVNRWWTETMAMKRSGGWKCRRCGQVNGALILECEKCKTPRP
ncbi:MAG: hypothetical protein NC819_00550 [Candidatus Omnitrophica bacterium]|nr:hypothetical protein [Candidatus Omnitrophota bacterium]